MEGLPADRETLWHPQVWARAHGSKLPPVHGHRCMDPILEPSPTEHGGCRRKLPFRWDPLCGLRWRREQQTAKRTFRLVGKFAQRAVLVVQGLGPLPYRVSSYLPFDMPEPSINTYEGHADVSQTLEGGSVKSCLFRTLGSEGLIGCINKKCRSSFTIQIASASVIRETGSASARPNIVGKASHRSKPEPEGQALGFEVQALA